MSKNFRSVLLGIDGATHNLHRDGGPNGGPTGGFSAPAAEVNGVTSMNITDPAAVAAT